MKISKLFALFVILFIVFCNNEKTTYLTHEEETFLAMNLLTAYLNAEIHSSEYTDNIGGSALIKFQGSDIKKALFTYAIDQSGKDTIQIKVCSITGFDAITPKESVEWYSVNIKDHKIDRLNFSQIFIDENILATIKIFDLHSPEGKTFYALEESVYNAGLIMLYDLNADEKDLVITGLIEPLTTTGVTTVDIWENTEQGYANIGNLDSIYLHEPTMVSQHIALMKSERSVFPDILSESLTSMHTIRVLYSYDEKSSQYVVNARYPIMQRSDIN